MQKECISNARANQAINFSYSEDRIVPSLSECKASNEFQTNKGLKKEIELYHNHQWLWLI